MGEIILALVTSPRHRDLSWSQRRVGCHIGRGYARDRPVVDHHDDHEHVDDHHDAHVDYDDVARNCYDVNLHDHNDVSRSDSCEAQTSVAQAG